MEKTLHLYARSDLRMRKGKIASQIGHAALAQLLNAMTDAGERRLLNAERTQVLRDFLAHPLIEFNFVDGEAGLDGALKDEVSASRIIDRGLTEFGGVPTLTCAAEGLFSMDPARFVPTAVNPIHARQWLIFSKEQPLRKDDAAVLAALGCLVQLHEMMIPDEDGGLILPLTDPALRAWLTDGFGKIGMGIKTNQALDDLERDLANTSVKTTRMHMGDNTLLVVGPAFSESVASIMGRDSERYTSGVLSLL